MQRWPLPVVGRVVLVVAALTGLVGGERLPQCSDVHALASHASAPSETPQSLEGTWVSERCETRPGPHFVLRSYAFYPDQGTRSGASNDTAGETGRFELKLHVYADPECRDPLRSYRARGHFGAQRPSLALPGAAEQHYWVKTISVVAHTDQEAEHVAESVATACPDRAKDWAAFKSDKIIWSQNDPKSRRTTNFLPQPHHSVAYFHDESTNTTRTVNLRSPATQAPSDNLNYMEGTTTHRKTEMDCRGEISVNWGELELFRLLASPTRIERSDSSYKHQSTSHDFGLREELLLGHPAPVASDLPHTSEEGYHPTTFQTPLVLATDENLRNCKNCRAVFTADTAKPPSLSASTQPAIRSPEGTWASSTCDAAPHGLFLVRKLEFRKKTWQAHQVHYTHHECSRAAYAFHASGDYAVRGSSTQEHQHQSVKIIPHSSGVFHEIEEQTASGGFHVRNLKSTTSRKSAKLTINQFGKTRPGTQLHTDDILVIFLALRNLTITPLASHVADQLNDANGGCGIKGKWEVGVSQDTTINRGCKSIGISVPSLHQYPFKLGLDPLNKVPLLFIGDAYASLSDSHPNISLVFPEHEDWRESPPDYDFELTVSHPRWGWGSPLTKCTDTVSGDSKMNLDLEDRWAYVNYDRHVKNTDKSTAPLKENSNTVYLRTTKLGRHNIAASHDAPLYVVLGSILLISYVN